MSLDPSALLHLLLPLFGGFIGGFYGASVGSGGLITLPTLLLVGLPAHVAVATNRFSTVFAEGAAVLHHTHKRTLSFRKLIPIGLSGMVGALIGSRIMLQIPERIMNITIALLLNFWRLIRGPSLPDRVVAFDLMTSVAVGIMALYSIATEETVFLDVAIVLALISFLGTVAFARYLEQRGKK